MTVVLPVAPFAGSTFLSAAPGNTASEDIVDGSGFGFEWVAFNLEADSDPGSFCSVTLPGGGQAARLLHVEDPPAARPFTLRAARGFVLPPLGVVVAAGGGASRGATARWTAQSSPIPLPSMTRAWSSVGVVAGGAPFVQPVFAGAHSVVVSGVGDPSWTSVYLSFGPGAGFADLYPHADGFFRPTQICAPDGFTLPELTVNVSNNASASVSAQVDVWWFF